MAFEFEPHGAKFKVPLKFTQILTLTNYIPGTRLQGGYFKSSTQCDDKNHKTDIDEVLPVLKGDGAVTLVHACDGHASY